MPRGARGPLTVLIAAVLVFAVVSVASDVRSVGDRLGGFGWWALAAALGLAVGNYLLRFVRWHLLLRDRDVDVPVGDSALVFVAGFALAITPGKVGELVKSYLLRTLHGVPVAQTAPVVIAERVADLLALLLLAVVGVAMYGVAVELVIGAGAVVGLGLLVLAWPALAYRLGELVTRPRPLRRFRDRVHEAVAGLAALSRPAVLSWSTTLSAAAWLCECLGFALIVSAFPGTAVPFGLAMLIYASTTIAGALSFLPGGLGVTEGAMTVLLVQGSHGVDTATAAAATILTRLATLWFAVGVGVIAMAAARRRAPSAEAEA
ncbi:MAG: flippase-like domain-containing protein, partial [Myxococcales bacterium]|nr:flippase-like domain-containing protein [Myxococcales bacterium]